MAVEQNRENKSYTNLFNLILIFCSLALVTNLFLGQLALQNNWVLTEFFGGAINAYHGGTFYPSPHELYPVSTVYFPGMMFLAYFCYWLSPGHALLLFLLLYTLFCTFFFVIMTDLIKKFGVSLSLSLLTMLFSIAILFSTLKGYLITTKPDALSLIFAITSFYSLIKIKQSKPTLLNLLLLIASLFLGAILKQQFISVYISAFLFAVLLKLPIKTKISIIGSTLLSGCLILIMLAVMKNGYYYTVFAQLKNPYQSLHSILLFSAECIKNYIYYLIPVIIGATYTIKNYNTLKNDYAKNWLIVAIPYLLLQASISIRSGGNNGEIEAGLLTLLPYAALGLSLMANNIKKYLSPALITCLLATTYILLGSTIKYYTTWKKNTYEQRTASSYLKQHFPKNAKSLFYDQYYFYLIRAGLHPTTSFYTSFNYNHPNGVAQNVINLIKGQHYQVALGEFKEPGSGYISRYYTHPNDRNMPHFLKKIIWIPIHNPKKRPNSSVS